MKTSLQHERRSTPNGRNPQTSSAGRTKHLRSVAKKQRQDFMASIQRLKPVSSKLLTSDIKTSLWHEKKKTRNKFQTSTENFVPLPPRRTSRVSCTTNEGTEGVRGFWLPDSKVPVCEANPLLANAFFFFLI